jgi:protein TonB
MTIVRSVLLVYCLWIAVGVSAQSVPATTPERKIEYYDRYGAVLSSAIGADHRVETIYQDSVAATVRAYYPSGKLKSSKQYANLRRNVLEGAYSQWYENGQVKRQETYLAGRLQGELRSYYPDGTLKRRERYATGTRKAGECFAPDGKAVTYKENDLKPAYLGGNEKMQQDIGRNTRYPREALRQQVSGKVFVSFLVEADGVVSDVFVVHSPSPLLNNASVQAVKHLGKFTPGQQDGEAVHTWMTVPITFAISTGHNGPALLSASVAPNKAQPQLPKHPGANVYRLASFRDSMHQSSGKAPVVYQHYFTYDSLGRPRTHQLNYLNSGKLMSVSKMQYAYGKNGQLQSKIDNRTKYLYFYNQNAQLTRIEFYILTQQQWGLCERTIINEKEILKNGSKVYSVALEKTVRPDKEALRLFSTADFNLLPNGLIEKSVVYRFNYVDLKVPTVYAYSYDRRINPLQSLFIQRWYHYGIEEEGLLNLVEKKQNDKLFRTNTYTYNDLGFPTKSINKNGVLQPYRTTTYTYAQITLPKDKATLKLGEGAGNSVSVFPNPASTNVTIQATGLGKGSVSVQLYTAATGQLQRNATYQVADKLEASLSVKELPAGVYVVKVVGPAATLESKLLVE